MLKERVRAIQKAFILKILSRGMEKNTLARLSKSLEVPEKRILNESVNLYIDSELRNTSAEILKIKQQFKVTSPEELRARISSGKIAEHPAWEHLIYWENLNKRIKVVHHWMQKLPISV